MSKKKAQPLQVRRSFEPDRLALSYVQEAYEQLVPTARYKVVNDDMATTEKHLESSSRKEKAT